MWRIGISDSQKITDGGIFEGPLSSPSENVAYCGYVETEGSNTEGFWPILRSECLYIFLVVSWECGQVANDKVLERGVYVCAYSVDHCKRL